MFTIFAILCKKNQVKLVFAICIYLFTCLKVMNTKVKRSMNLFIRLAMIGDGIECVPALSFCLSFVFDIVFVIEYSVCVCNNGLMAVMK